MPLPLPFATTDAPSSTPQAKTLWGPVLTQPPLDIPRLLADRFAHLNMPAYRTTMPSEGYLFFVTFAGVDTYGATQEDFDDLDMGDDL